MAQLTLYVPDLFSELLDDGAAGIDPTRWPVLALLLTRATVRPLDSTSVEQNLLALCGAESDSALPISIAGLTALVDLDAPSSSNLIRVDPVHLRADPHQLLLFNHASILPSLAEADSLLEELNTALPDLAIARGRHPARWYLCADLAADSSASSPRAVNGRSIADFLPRGAAVTQLMNDTQMLLHSAAVNTAREARGTPAINSIWPWGGAPISISETMPPDFIVGDDVLAAACARHFAVDWCAASEPGEIIARIARHKARGLVVVGAPSGSVEPDAQLAGLDVFEQDWCGLLLKSLRRFRIAELRLITDRHCHLVTPLNLLRLWRRPSMSAAL